MSGEIANFLGENRALVLFIAFLGDAIVGGRRGLAWLPGPDGLIAGIVGLFSGRLDRISRDSSTRMVRGTAVALILAAIGFFAGWAIERWAAASAPGALVIVVLIGLVIGQRYALDTTLELARRLARDRNPSEAGHYGVARWCVERMANRFADGMIANSLFFLAFGLGGLFAYRVLANLVARGAPKGVLMPESPYYRWPARLYRWITLPAGATSALAVWLAGLAVPGRPFRERRLAYGRGGFAPETIPLRLWTVRAFAETLGLALKADPDNERRDRLAAEIQWVGPKDGRARADARDVRRAAYLFAISWAVTIAILGGVALMMLRP